MKNNKADFLISFFGLIISVVFIIIFIGKILEIRSTLESMDQYRNILNETHVLPLSYLSDLDNQVKNLRNREISGEGLKTKDPQGPEEHIGMIRDLLRNHKIEVERFRTIGKEGISASEFILNGEGVNFFNFLKEAPKIQLPLNYISIKPTSGFSKINATVRFNHVP
ncbi:hypothetical protein [Treponema primitia]|uniref:hypothetical protein n=1 Tax=Treponema primitia TaxID=88058 RepID=UPI00025555C3|nr:hypothetical protein [Treponema primitia]